MSAFIKLNKQDAFVVPYTAHKSYSYSNAAERVAAGIVFALGENDNTLFNSSSDSTSGGQYNKLTYRSIKQLYYSNVSGAIDISGSFEDYPQSTLYFTRSLEDTAALILIPKDVYGQNIKPGTFKFISGSSFKIEDDGEGNLFASGAVTYSTLNSSSFDYTLVNFQATGSSTYDNIPSPDTIVLADPIQEFTGSLQKIEWRGLLAKSPLYIDNGVTQVQAISGASDIAVIEFNNSTEVVSSNLARVQFADNIATDSLAFHFTSSSLNSVETVHEIYSSASIADGEYIGNIFYSHGNAIITKDSIASRYYGKVLRSGSLEWQGSHTTFQYEYRCKVNESSLNYSQHPSVIQSSSNGTVYDFATGSYFQPYVTTIGLHNEYGELVAVGKLAQPVPKSRYTDMTFVVKFDV